MPFLFVGLGMICFTAFGQTKPCKIKIIRLRFENNQQIKQGKITDSLLALAKLTTSTLIDNADIKTFELKIDSACCTYAGQIFTTSHRYVLTSETVSHLASLDIPLCCGIPVAIYIDDKEVYRAMLWNVVSSFGNKSLTMTLVNDTLIVNNQLPNVPDFLSSGILTNNKQLANCLTDNNN